MAIAFNIDTFCLHCMKKEAIVNGKCRFCGKSSDFHSLSGVLPPGSILAGRFLLGESLGSGGYGITYQAIDLTTESILAVKEYRPERMCERESGKPFLTVTSPDYFEYGLRHFDSEIEILNKLQDVPEVVRFYGTFSENNTKYYLMEFLKGKTLLKYLKDEHNGSMNYRSAVMLLIPAILGICKCHEKKTLHRDISPDNIYICEDNTIRIIDFGAATLDSVSFSVSYMPVAKEGYSSPEQMLSIDRSGHDQGTFSDVYSMAGTLYRCVTGKKPESASQRAAGQVLKKPKDLNRSLTEEQSDLIERNMSMSSAERDQSMLSFAKNLVNLLSLADAHVLREQYPMLASETENSVSFIIRKTDDSDELSKTDIKNLKGTRPEPVSATKKTHIRVIWKRVFAFFIDSLIFQLFPYSLSILLHSSPWLWLIGGFVLSITLCSVMTCSAMQGSPGEIILGLKVTGTNGKRLSPGYSILRSIIRLFILTAAVNILCTFLGYDLTAGYAKYNCDGLTSSPNHSSRQWKLSFSEGAYRNSCILLQKGICTIGRDPTMCNIVFPTSYPGVSRQHLSIEIDAQGRCFVTDMSSTGTAVNGQRLISNFKTCIEPGSEITFAMEKMLLINL